MSLSTDQEVNQLSPYMICVRMLFTPLPPVSHKLFTPSGIIQETAKTSWHHAMCNYSHCKKYILLAAI